jgi:uncharacterized repeat protein (TIGR02543 family)
MKKFHRISVLIIALISLLSVFLLFSCGQTSQTTVPTIPTNSSTTTSTQDGTTGTTIQKIVKSLTVQTKPKDYYVSGDTFDPEGGIILVTYTDDTTELKPMTSDFFEITPPGMNATGTKLVTVKVRGGTIQVKFPISIGSGIVTVTYNYNYQGAQNEVVDVIKGNVAEEKLPIRTGYTFVDWYMDSDFIRPFDLSTKISKNIELFALWTNDAVAHYNVTFDYDYYGDAIVEYSYPVDGGAQVAQPVDPTRIGYTFDKWVLDSANYIFSTPVSQAITLKATWTRNNNDVKTYVFEAEDTDLTGKIGPSYSGTVQEKAMIVTAPADRGCSNGRFVSFLYQEGNSLEFFIVCDEDLDDVTIYIRLSAEWGDDFTYNKDNFGIYIIHDGVEAEIDYPAIEMKNIPEPLDPDRLDCLPFQDFSLTEVGITLSLKKGANCIQIRTENNIPYPGTTMLAHAPIVDCIKIETTGVVIWDANFKLPFYGNYFN